MNRRALIRNVVLGALITGAAPLTGAGAGSAAAADSPAALCQSSFGETGPTGGAVVGEGPSGDPMGTTIGWDPADWSDGLREIVTCVSVGGRAVPALTVSTSAPRNDGSLVISLTLPAGEPGSLACEQSVLLGAGKAADRHRTTSPVCFKLRAPEPTLGSAFPAARPAPGPVPAVPAGPPPRPAPTSPVNATPAPPVTRSASTPPARAAFEAARGGIGLGSPRDTSPDPRLSVGVPSPVWPDPAVSAPAARAAARPSAAAGAAAATHAAGTPTGAPSTSLARTGLEHHIPLAGAGGFLAIGGAAIILGAPGRRRPVRRSA